MGLLFLALKEPIPPIFRLLRNVYERVSTSEVLMLLIFKKHEYNECIIQAFAFETTRAKRVP